MSFDLRIQFLGLCAYVPEDGARMHVLLPLMNHSHMGEEGLHRGRSGAGGGVHAHQDASSFRDGADLFTGRPADNDDDKSRENDRHYPGLMYDRAYRTPNQVDLMRQYQYEHLDGRFLDLSSLSTAEGLDTRLTSELPDLKDVSEPVPPELVQGPPHGSLAARVTMAHGALTRYALGAAFHLTSITERTRMTWETEWTIRGIEGHVDSNGVACLPPLVLQGPTLRDKFELPALYPVRQTIHLTIFNAVSSVFPPNGALYKVPKPLQKTDHFLAYHELSRPRAPVRKPVAAEEMDVEVYGEVPKPVGKHIPGVVCVQVQTRLADG